MSIEALLQRVAEAVEANTEQLKVVEAGRAASLEKLMQKGAEADSAPAAKATRSRKKDAEQSAAAEQPQEGNAATAADAVSPASTSTAPSAQSSAQTQPAEVQFSPLENELRAAVSGYIDGGKTDEEKTARTENIKAIMAHFGGLLCGPKSTLDDEQRKQALFYVRRYAAGCAVDFGQDYDFDGDPTQGGIEPATADADEFDIG